MIKTAQDAYLAGRQAAMEKLATTPTTGLKTTKDLPEVSYMDSYLGLGGVLAAAGLGGVGTAAALGNLPGAVVGTGILGAYAPTLLGAHRAKKMLEREGLSPEEINRRAPEMNALAPLSTLGTTAVGSGIGAALGAGLAQFNIVPGFGIYESDYGDYQNPQDAMRRAQDRKTQKHTNFGAGLGGLLGLGYGMYKDYSNPMNEAQRIIDEHKALK
jgi:hypothetical protein